MITQASRRQEGSVRQDGAFWEGELKSGRASDLGCRGDNGIVITVKPIIKAYPKCNEGMAARQTSLVSGTQEIGGMETLWKRTILVAKLIGRPDAPSTGSSMNRVHKAITTREIPNGPFNRLVAE